MLKRILFIFHVVMLCQGSIAFAVQSNYSIIIDAGSSGSRLHLYQYERQQALPEITDILSKKIKPGISSYADNPEQAATTLKPLLDDALSTIQQQQADPKDVTISILATAGMRLLPSEKQDRIYQAIRQYISKHYPFSINRTETVPEKMEGIYGWLDVNYLANNFNSSSDTTEGTLDLGGASMEITLAVKESSDPENEVALTINNKHYIVFSKSFLGLGQDQAKTEMNRYPNAASCYPANYPLSENTIGNYQFANCKNIYTNIIQQHHVAELHPELNNQHFIAFSAFYFVSHFFESDIHASQNQLEQHIEKECGQSWQQLQQAHPDIAENFLSTYCASGAYISDLLYNTYHLSSDQITISDNVNQQAIDWPLGALLYSLM